jgi:hypothetical protein
MPFRGGRLEACRFVPDGPLAWFLGRRNFTGDRHHYREELTALFALAGYSRMNPLRSLVMLKLPSAPTDIFKLCP